MADGFAWQWSGLYPGAPGRWCLTAAVRVVSAGRLINGFARTQQARGSSGS
jgi:hypothetical protein